MRPRQPCAPRRQAKNALHYPKGKRTSYALGRAGNFGVGIDVDAWREEVNRHLLLHVIIEEAEAITHLDEILAHPALDVVECGPADLRLSLGLKNAILCVTRQPSAG